MITAATDCAAHYGAAPAMIPLKAQLRAYHAGSNLDSGYKTSIQERLETKRRNDKAKADKQFIAALKKIGVDVPTFKRVQAVLSTDSLTAPEIAEALEMDEDEVTELVLQYSNAHLIRLAGSRNKQFLWAI